MENSKLSRPCGMLHVCQSSYRSKAANIQNCQWLASCGKQEVDAHAAASASNMTGNMHSNSRWQRVSEAVRFSNLNSAPSQSYRQKQEDALGMFLRKNKAECASQAISRRGMLKTCIISPTAPNESPEKPRCARTQSP